MPRPRVPFAAEAPVLVDLIAGARGRRSGAASRAAVRAAPGRPRSPTARRAAPDRRDACAPIPGTPATGSRRDPCSRAACARSACAVRTIVSVLRRNCAATRIERPVERRGGSPSASLHSCFCSVGAGLVDSVTAARPVDRCAASRAATKTRPAMRSTNRASVRGSASSALARATRCRSSTVSRCQSTRMRRPRATLPGMSAARRMCSRSPRRAAMPPRDFAVPADRRRISCTMGGAPPRVSSAASAAVGNVVVLFGQQARLGCARSSELQARIEVVDPGEVVQHALVDA